MADCGICLDVLRNPVSIPCGHVHCERCLRGHISSGTDALKSTCPTCRKSFHIAIPDFSFVPQKYHDFIVPSVRKIYMDIPSVATLTAEIDTLKQSLENLTKDNEHLRERYADYKYMIDKMASEKHALLAREEDAQYAAAEIRKKYDSLKKRYQEVQARDHACNMTSQSLSRKSSQNFETICLKVEETPVSLQDWNSRPKRALPKSRLTNVRHRDEQSFVKRQRIHRRSDADPCNQLLSIDFKNEDDEEEE